MGATTGAGGASQGARGWRPGGGAVDAAMLAGVLRAAERAARGLAGQGVPGSRERGQGRPDSGALLPAGAPPQLPVVVLQQGLHNSNRPERRRPGTGGARGLPPGALRMECALHKSIPLKGLPMDEDGAGFGAQLEANGCHDALYERRRKDRACFINVFNSSFLTIKFTIFSVQSIVSGLFGTESGLPQDGYPMQDLCNTDSGEYNIWVSILLRIAIELAAFVVLFPIYISMEIHSIYSIN